MRFYPASIQQNQPKHPGKPWNSPKCREPEGLIRIAYCDPSPRTGEYAGTGGRILITQRSLVQIQPPQPRRSTGYGSRRSPLGFSRNVRLEIAAPNLVVRVRIIRRFTDNPGPHPRQPDPDEPIAPAQRGPARRPLVHGERLAQGEVLESELVVAAAEGREESKQTFSGSCQAIFLGRCRSCCRAIVAKWYCSSYGTWRSHRTKMARSAS
jgi:hypothetical protein